MTQTFDVIVIGGGHAGCEAAAAAARCGARTALLTADRGRIGAMSCNPSIGGVGKGHLVRELDVFDGLLARAADTAAIHYRMLNRSKGAAVRGPRVQADRKRFGAAIRKALAAQRNCVIVEGMAARIVVDSGRAAGVRLEDGNGISAGAVVLATGTFLGAQLHLGLERRAGGRIGEPPATALADQLRSFGLPMGRLKTGTPPRIDGRTIDWGRLAMQPSDREPWTMSAIGRRTMPQLACAVTRTTERTHALIRAAMDRSPLFTGAIEGLGPRYCPSIEDKVVRFAERDGHQLFLEPEGLDDATVYPNGISTSLPADVQQALVASIPGLEAARIVQPGYAVEYDHVDPHVLDHGLQVRGFAGLYCAGQINGTTGYEEAAAQGLVAGATAAAAVLGREPIAPSRADSYIGVMIDDLVLQGITEPYRMLTARAEARLSLRADNAVSRLGPAALRSGLVGAERTRAIEQHLARREMLQRLSADELARVDDMAAVNLVDEIREDRRYAPYVERQQAEQRRHAGERGVSLRAIDRFAEVGGLSTEMIERLEAARPATLGEAARVRGITPAAISALLVAARRAA